MKHNKNRIGKQIRNRLFYFFFVFLIFGVISIQAASGSRFDFQLNSQATGSKKKNDRLTVWTNDSETILKDKHLYIRMDWTKKTNTLYFIKAGAMFTDAQPFNFESSFTRFARIRLNRYSWPGSQISNVSPDSSSKEMLFNIHVKKILGLYARLSGLQSTSYREFLKLQKLPKQINLYRRIGSTSRNWILVLKKFNRRGLKPDMNISTNLNTTVNRITSRMLSPMSTQVKLKTHPERKHVMDTLMIMAKGYRDRDPKQAESWCKRLFHPRFMLLGTGSITPGTFEWFKGREWCPAVFKSDWQRWGAVSFDFDELELEFINDHTAIINLPAMVVRGEKENTIDSRSFTRSLKNALIRSRNFADDQSLSAEQQAVHILWDLSRIYKQYSYGAQFHWPFRISATLVKDTGKWVFIQMHWSHPTRGFPTIRVNPQLEVLK